MIAKWIDIAGGKWRVVVYYDVMPENTDWIAGQFVRLGASREETDDAMTLFEMPNRACAMSDPRERMSLVCIGWVTSRAQWHNSIIHEIDHVKRDICEYYGVELGSETAAHLQGKLGEEMLL